jgi:hypothetical protein
MSVRLMVSLKQSHRIALFCLVLTLSACTTRADTDEIVVTGHGGFQVFSLTKERNAYFPKSVAHDQRLKRVRQIARKAQTAAWLGAKARLSEWRDHDWHDYGYDEYVTSTNFIREIRSNRVSLADKTSSCTAELALSDVTQETFILPLAPGFEDHEQYWRCQEGGVDDLFFDITEDSILTVASAKASCGKTRCQKISIFRTPSGIPHLPESRQDWLSMATRTDIYFMLESLQLIQTIEYQPHSSKIRRIYDFSSKVERFTLPSDCKDAIEGRYVLQSASEASAQRTMRDSVDAQTLDASSSTNTASVLVLKEKDLEAAGVASMQELVDAMNDGERRVRRCRYAIQ